MSVGTIAARPSSIATARHMGIAGIVCGALAWVITVPPFEVRTIVPSIVLAKLVLGDNVMQKAFIDQHAQAVREFATASARAVDWSMEHPEEARKLIDPDQVKREAVEREEQSGIVFIDEMDKIAGREGGVGPGRVYRGRVGVLPGVRAGRFRQHEVDQVVDRLIALDLDLHRHAEVRLELEGYLHRVRGVEFEVTAEYGGAECWGVECGGAEC